MTESNDQDAPAIRHGNPFAEGSIRDGDGLPAEAAGLTAIGEVWIPESGVLKSCITASALVLIFAGLCYVLFPGGGVVVAGLGAGLSIVGLFSTRTIVAVILLIAHVGLFASCYIQLWNG